jgi:hypothetical protein
MYLSIWDEALGMFLFFSLYVLLISSILVHFCCLNGRRDDGCKLDV